MRSNNFYPATRRHAVFRCDASHTIGGGHIMRCLTLARAMADADYNVVFACCDLPQSFVTVVKKAGFPLINLANPLSASDLIDKLGSRCVDELIVDHYGLDAAYERKLRTIARRIVVIDDVPNRVHDCDILIDQTFGRSASDYSELVPEGAVLLTGAQYAMLRPEFARARPAVLARRAKTTRVGRILISMGMTDIGGITLSVLEAVLAANTKADIDIVLGSAAPSLLTVRELVARNAAVRLHVNTADMCSLMVAADLAIGAAGSTTWERCCLALPSILMVVATNQNDIAATLVEAGAATMVRTPEDLSKPLRRLIEQPQLRTNMTELASVVTDGYGVNRILGFLRPFVSHYRPRAQDLLRIRPGEAGDLEILWKWRNDATVRSASKSRERIPWGTHVRWLLQRLADDDGRLLIAELEGIPVGMARLDRLSDGKAKVSISVDPIARRRGVGSVLLNEVRTVAAGSSVTVLEAEIRPDNRPSLKLFELHGYRLVKQDRDVLCFQLVTNAKSVRATGAIQ